MKLNTITERSKYNIRKNAWTVKIGDRCLDVVDFLISEGYTDFEEKTYEGGGHYGLPLHHCLECNDPEGNHVHDACHLANKILKERYEKAFDQIMGIKI